LTPRYLGVEYLDVKTDHHAMNAPLSDRAEKAVAQWRRERPDLDPSPMALLGRLAEAAHVIARDRLNPLFARFGLQPGEFDVLATLRRSGAPFVLTPTQLYEATMVSSGGMTNRLDRLERAGLIERRPDPGDRRGVLVALTGAGRVLIDEAVTAHVANEHDLLAPLGAGEREMLGRLLGKLLAAAKEKPADIASPEPRPSSSRRRGSISA
jgi:DNA-binding MarR family transcriptional regulator